MAVVCPAVLAENPASYREDIQRISPFASRVQIDIADGNFTSNKTVNLAQVYWPEGVQADLHMMVQNPDELEHDYISLAPNLVIVHAEALDGAKSKVELFSQLKAVGIKTGLALLPESQPADFEDLIKLADHVLIFTGQLGHYGGQLDERQLPKIEAAKAIKPGIEVGVDGGINDQNAAFVLRAGADVLNVGGFIQKSDDPGAAYATIERIIQTADNRE